MGWSNMACLSIQYTFFWYRSVEIRLRQGHSNNLKDSRGVGLRSLRRTKRRNFSPGSVFVQLLVCYTSYSCMRTYDVAHGLMLVMYMTLMHTIDELAQASFPFGLVCLGRLHACVLLPGRFGDGSGSAGAGDFDSGCAQVGRQGG